MTDDIATYGLGALPDAPDERDYPLSALYASEGLTASVVLPATYVAPGMPPVLDQRATPMCVAYSSSAMKAWQDRRDQERFFDFDEPTFFAEIGGTAQGAYVRAAMERMRTRRLPGRRGRATPRTTGSPPTTPSRATSPRSRRPSSTSARSSCPPPGTARGSTRPRASCPGPTRQSAGTRSSPTAGTRRGLRLRNSWGSAWGVCGRLLDAGVPRPAPHPAPGRPSTRSSTRSRTPTPSTSWRGPASTSARRPPRRRPRSPRCPTGATWRRSASRSTAASTRSNGAVRTDWLEVKVGTRTGWVARGYTRLVK